MRVKLIQPVDDLEAWEISPDDASEHDQEWSENSVMRCTNGECEKQGIAEEFEMEEEEESV